MKRICCLLVLALVFAICAGCGTIQRNTTPPPDYQAEDSRVFNQPYEKVWQAVVQSVGSSFFILDNIQKDSGILTLSFSVQDPNEYIDCGIMNTQGTGLYSSRSISIPWASAGPYVEPNPHPTLGVINLVHSNTLSGKVNILVQKLGAKQTKVSIKTRYVLVHTGIVQETGTHASHTMSFNGNETGKFSNSPNSIVCKSRGTMDKMILDNIAKEL